MGYHKSLLGEKMNLVCIHGNSLNSSIFDEISIPFANKTAINLPGHGGRSIGNNKSFLDLVDTVFDDLEGKKDLVLFGSSLGGHITYHLLSKLAPLAIITISSPPLNIENISKAFLPNPLGALLFQEEISESDSLNLSRKMLHLKNQDAPKLSQMIQSTDPKIRGVIGQSLMRGEFLDEVKLLTNFNGKKIFLTPTDESFVNSDYIRSLNLGDAIEVSGGHILTQDNPRMINEILSRELSKLRT
jgi:pimeloyl-ACP methyl ester carboxylesterase